MITQNWLYDAMLYMYALSLLFYFSDFVDRNRQAKRMGTGLLIFVWVLQTAFLIHRIISHINLSFMSLFEYLLFFSWLLITISLVISRFFRIEFIVFFVNVAGFAVLTLNLFGIRSGVSLEPWQVARELLVVHVSLMICAYAALTIGAIFSGMYLFLHGRLKSRRWTKTVQRLPSLDVINRSMYRFVLIGTPLLTMSLAIAVTSIMVEGRYGLLLDLKVIVSLIAMVFYIWNMLHYRWFDSPSWKTARWNLFCFALLLFTLVINEASSFHSWS
ncbi:Cytochrome c biogenesis protein CcsA [Paenibacillus plantiphilus]|uniref:Cytochrome c biogenesis protein CcsA n=1 Tax=Paenibacillus plantiphilus TaxID=2905650 RepID=A0ABN8GGM0_9BACL|nr:cytochrome c biogenesis protein CcsA [Paenibacillus plantiphilus]CAH1204152.1 Cytochrome c biogenesis protein CcsA [Paenibacillus plantiphilus]